MKQQLALIWKRIQGKKKNGSFENIVPVGYSRDLTLSRFSTGKITDKKRKQTTCKHTVLYSIITRGPGQDDAWIGWFAQAGIGALAAATVSEVHLVWHQHMKKLQPPEILSLLSAKHTLLQALSWINPMHTPL